MNKLAFTLALTTVVFASTTVYFAHAFRTERERAAHPPALRVAGNPASAPLPRDGSTPPRPVDSGPAPGPPAATAPNKAQQIAFARARLNRLTDPQGRAEQLANVTALLRTNLYAVAKGVGWSRDELDRVVATLAERRLQLAEARLRCDVTAECAAVPTPAAVKEADRQDIAQLLGEEKAARYEAYFDSASERGTVGFMRPRLSESGQVSDAQAERLISALAEENRHFTEAARLQGADVTTHGLEAGQILAAGTVKSAEGRARMLESATEYARHLHDRAAEILTPSQLIEFDDMQEETLRSLRESLKFHEIGESARADR